MSNGLTLFNWVSMFNHFLCQEICRRKPVGNWTKIGSFMSAMICIFCLLEYFFLMLWIQKPFTITKQNHMRSLNLFLSDF